MNYTLKTTLSDHCVDGIELPPSPQKNVEKNIQKGATKLNLLKNQALLKKVAAENSNVRQSSTAGDGSCGPSEVLPEAESWWLESKKPFDELIDSRGCPASQDVQFFDLPRVDVEKNGILIPCVKWGYQLLDFAFDAGSAGMVNVNDGVDPKLKDRYINIGRIISEQYGLSNLYPVGLVKIYGRYYFHIRNIKGENFLLSSRNDGEPAKEATYTLRQANGTFCNYRLLEVTLGDMLPRCGLNRNADGMLESGAPVWLSRDGGNKIYKAHCLIGGILHLDEKDSDAGLLPNGEQKARVKDPVSKEEKEYTVLSWSDAEEFIRKNNSEFTFETIVDLFCKKSDQNVVYKGVLVGTQQAVPAGGESRENRQQIVNVAQNNEVNSEQFLTPDQSGRIYSNLVVPTGWERSIIELANFYPTLFFPLLSQCGAGGTAEKVKNVSSESGKYLKEYFQYNKDMENSIKGKLLGVLDRSKSLEQRREKFSLLARDFLKLWLLAEEASAAQHGDAAIYEYNTLVTPSAIILNDTVTYDGHAGMRNARARYEKFWAMLINSSAQKIDNRTVYVMNPMMLYFVADAFRDEEIFYFIQEKWNLVALSENIQPLVPRAVDPLTQEYLVPPELEGVLTLPQKFADRMVKAKSNRRNAYVFFGGGLALCCVAALCPMLDDDKAIALGGAAFLVTFGVLFMAPGPYYWKKWKREDAKVQADFRREVYENSKFRECYVMKPSESDTSEPPLPADNLAMEALREDLPKQLAAAQPAV